MKIFNPKIITTLAVGAGLLCLLSLIVQLPPQIYPTSAIQDKSNLLNSLIRQNFSDPFEITYRPFLSEYQIDIQQSQAPNLTIIIPFNSDLPSQVITLQKILSKAKLTNHKTITFINLSTRYPYATYQNN